ncbi:MAG: hypothetical protein ABIG93_01560 [archaeon]|nr:hypothetical protein [Nanoarchaeota archaeon]
MEPQQRVLYSVASKKSRILVPNALTLIILGVVFYMGILLNVGLLALDAETETIVKSSSIFVVILIVLVGILLNLKKAKTSYQFYQTTITNGKSNINYADIENIQVKRCLWDRMFGTYTLKLSKKFSVEGIPKKVDLQNYVQQMVNYNRRSQVQTY